MGDMAERIERKLKAALAPSEILVTDESHKHAGHAGARPEGETHFDVQITSEAFANKSKVECHRIVYRVLDDELKASVHALALKTTAPDEV